MSLPLTKPPSILGVTIPTDDPLTPINKVLGLPSLGIITSIAVIFLVVCLMVLIFNYCNWRRTWYYKKLDGQENEKLVQKSKTAPNLVPADCKKSKKSLKEAYEKCNGTARKNGPPDALDTYGDEIVYERKKNDRTSDELTNQQGNKKDRKGSQNLDDSSRLHITSAMFERVFQMLIYKPTNLEILRSDERDPAKSVVQNWFEYCQPEFDIPAELRTLSLANPDLCMNEKVCAWDSTALIIDNQEFYHGSLVQMPGETKQGTAIICQAPMDKQFVGKKDTCTTFWKMIEEYKVDYIVMACLHVENGKTKCGKYFPEKTNCSLTFGDFVVTLTDAREMFGGELMARKFTYQKNSDKEFSKKVSHYQFMKWKEGEIPKESMSLEAIKYVHDVVRRQMKPYVIHSSLGTGRACVFTGIEYLSSQICNKSVRAFTHAFQVDYRTKRMGAIQTGEQLFFVQNMALDLVIKELHFEKFQPEMKSQWDALSHYFDKGTYNRKALDELDVYEEEKFGATVPFTATGKKQIIRTDQKLPDIPIPPKESSAEKALKKKMAGLKKKKSGAKGTVDKTTTVTGDKNTTADSTVDKTAITQGSQLGPPPLESIPKQNNVEKMDMDAEDK